MSVIQRKVTIRLGSFLLLFFNKAKYVNRGWTWSPIDMFCGGPHHVLQGHCYDWIMSWVSLHVTNSSIYNTGRRGRWVSSAWQASSRRSQCRGWAEEDVKGITTHIAYQPQFLLIMITWTLRINKHPMIIFKLSLISPFQHLHFSLGAVH